MEVTKLSPFVYLCDSQRSLFVEKIGFEYRRKLREEAIKKKKIGCRAQVVGGLTRSA